MRTLLQSASGGPDHAAPAAVETLQREQAGARGRRYALFSAAAVWIALAVVAPMLMIDWRARSPISSVTTILLAWLIVAYTAYALASIWFSGRATLVRTASLIFVYVFLGLSVLAEVVTATYPLTLPYVGDYSDGLVRRGLLAVIVGIAAFEFAYHGLGSYASSRSKAKTGATVARRLISPRRIVILGVVGLLMSLVLLARTGLSVWFESWQARADAQFGVAAGSVAHAATDKATGALLRFAAQTPVFLACYGLLYLRHHKLWSPQTRMSRLLTQWLTAALALDMVVLNNPLSNSRFWFGLVGISIASIYIPLRKRIGIRLVIGGSILVLLFAFTSLQAFRRSGGTGATTEGPRQDLTNSSTYAAFEVELAALDWLDSGNGHTGGRQLLGSVLIFVPRSLWPGKPVDTGNLVVPYGNPSAAAWTEGEIEGGPLGIVIVLAGLGSLASALDRRLIASDPATLVAAATPVVAGFYLLVLRGSFLAAAGPAYMLAICIAFMSQRRRALPSAVPARTTSGRNDQRTFSTYHS